MNNKKEELYILKLHKKISLLMYFESEIHKNTMRNDSNWYHFLVDIHYENYHNYHQRGNYYCFFVADVMKKEKKEIINFETTHKIIYIHVFLTSLAQIEEC